MQTMQQNSKENGFQIFKSMISNTCLSRAHVIIYFGQVHNCVGQVKIINSLPGMAIWSENYVGAWYGIPPSASYSTSVFYPALLLLFLFFSSITFTSHLLDQTTDSWNGFRWYEQTAPAPTCGWLHCRERGAPGGPEENGHPPRDNERRPHTATTHRKRGKGIVIGQ